MKKIKIVLLSIIFFLLSINHIYALDEGFYSTISFTIGSVPPIEKVSYTSSHVEGEYSTDIFPNTTTLDYLTTDNYRSRIYNEMQKLAVPPFSRIDIGYYWYNYTPDEVDVETIRIPLSRENVSKGDITQLLYEKSNQEFELGVTYSDKPHRGGKHVDIEGVGLLDSDMDSEMKKGVIVESFITKPAVELSRWEVEVLGENLSRLTLYVRNNTDQSLEDIWVNHEGASHVIINLAPFEERRVDLFKKCIVNEEDINCGTIRFIDRNTKTHCMVYGSSWNNYLRPDSISLWSKIEGEWVSGAQTQPAMESFCIQRLPYRYRTEELIVTFEPPPPEPTQEEYWENILGLELLPITNYQSSRERFFRLIKPLFTDSLKIL